MHQISISPTSARTARWWPDGAVYAADFVSNRFMRDQQEVLAPTAFSLARASTKLARDAAGRWHSFASNQAAQTNKGVTVEAAETYYPANSALAGASIGIVGSGGALPTGWTAPSWTQVTVVALGTHEGLDVITLDLTANNISGGTALGRSVMFYNLPTTQGEFWTMGLFGELISVFGDDTCTPATNMLQIQERSAANVFLNNNNGIIANFNAVGLSTRQTKTKEMTAANAAQVQGFYSWNDIAAGTYFHRRVALKMPSMTKSQTVSSPMQTTSSGTVTRAADGMTLHLPAGTHSLTTHYADGTSASIGGVSGDYSVPANSDKVITKISAQPD